MSRSILGLRILGAIAVTALVSRAPSADVDTSVPEEAAGASTPLSKRAAE